MGIPNPPLFWVRALLCPHFTGEDIDSQSLARAQTREPQKLPLKSWLVSSRPQFPLTFPAPWSSAAGLLPAHPIPAPRAPCPGDSMTDGIPRGAGAMPTRAWTHRRGMELFPLSPPQGLGSIRSGTVPGRAGSPARWPPPASSLLCSGVRGQRRGLSFSHSINTSRESPPVGSMLPRGKERVAVRARGGLGSEGPR